MTLRSSLLLFGRDFNLLASRRLLLQARGYQVSATTDITAVPNLLKANKVDLVILCHSLSMEECGRVIGLVAPERPEIETLVLRAGLKGCQTPMSRNVFDTLEGPAKFVSFVGRMVEVAHSHSFTR